MAKLSLWPTLDPAGQLGQLAYPRMWVRQRSALQHWALDLIARLWESERWSAASCAQLREHLYGCGALPAGA